NGEREKGRVQYVDLDGLDRRQGTAASVDHRRTRFRAALGAGRKVSRLHPVDGEGRETGAAPALHALDGRRRRLSVYEPPQRSGRSAMVAGREADRVRQLIKSRGPREAGEEKEEGRRPEARRESIAVRFTGERRRGEKGRG